MTLLVVGPSWVCYTYVLECSGNALGHGRSVNSACNKSVPTENDPRHPMCTRGYGPGKCSLQFCVCPRPAGAVMPFAWVLAVGPLNTKDQSHPLYLHPRPCSTFTSTLQSQTAPLRTISRIQDRDAPCALNPQVKSSHSQAKQGQVKVNSKSSQSQGQSQSHVKVESSAATSRIEIRLSRCCSVDSVVTERPAAAATPTKCSSLSSGDETSATRCS